MGIDLTWFEENIMRRKMGEDEKEAVSRMFEVKPYEAGETIITQDKPGSKFHILRLGSADVFRETGGARTRIASAGEGALFGELTFLAGEPTTAHVVARDACVVYMLARDSFTEMMQRHQDLVYALFAHMLEHTAKVIRHMNDEHIGMMQYIMGRKV